MSHLINAKNIPFEEFGKMLADILPDVDTVHDRGEEWYLDSSIIEVNKDILYDVYLKEIPKDDPSIELTDEELEALWDEVLENGFSDEFSVEEPKTEIKAGEKLFIIRGPYDNDNTYQARYEAERISKIVGDKITVHSIDDVWFSGNGKNGEKLQECLKETSYKSVKDMIKDININQKNTHLDMKHPLVRTSVMEKLRNNLAKIAERGETEPKPERQKPIRQDISL